MTNAPAEIYAVGLVSLMARQNVHHFVVERADLDPEATRGLAINIKVEPDRMTFTTGRCDCAECAALRGTQ